MFWANTWTPRARAPSRRPRSAVNGTQMRDVDAVDRRDPRQQPGDVLLRLGDGLVHLPVARDQRSPASCASTSTPGSVFPSSSSRDAPPPVDMWVTSSGQPELRDRRGRVAAADDRRTPTSPRPPRRPPRCRRRTARARTRPSGRSRRRSPAPRDDFAYLPRSRARCRGPSSRRGRRRRRAPALGVGGEAIGRARGRPAGRSLSSPAASALRAGSTPSCSHSESPTSWPCARKNGKHIAPPISITSATLEECVDDADLVGHLRAADDGDERTFGVGEDRRQRRRPRAAAGDPRRAATAARRPRSRRGRGARRRTRRRRRRRPAPHSAPRARGRSLRLARIEARTFSSSTTSSPPARLGELGREADAARPSSSPSRARDRLQRQLRDPRPFGRPRWRAARAARRARAAPAASAAQRGCACRR